MKLARIVVALVPVITTLGHAQDASATRCPYERCALGIAPVWHGLAIVRGAEAERVATLGFFRARRLPLFDVHDSAAAAARRAVRTRRVASLLTDLGLVAGATGVTRAIAMRRVDRGGAIVASAAGIALGASIPLQFSADGHLSRAVWWYNAAIANPTPVGVILPTPARRAP